ncbi:Uncharacterised protein [Macrococcoides caseolyticum]|nr:hypothetical protein [Macrococcus caseolyticus]STY78299.1 Uncharacterised protein [Macrococcus caseolyticus]
MRQIEKIVSRYIDILETYITTRDEKALEPLCSEPKKLNFLLSYFH